MSCRGITHAQGSAALGEASGPPAPPGRSPGQPLSPHRQQQGLLEGGTELFVAWEGGRKSARFPCSASVLSLKRRGLKENPESSVKHDT